MIKLNKNFIKIDKANKSKFEHTEGNNLKYSEEEIIIEVKGIFDEFWKPIGFKKEPVEPSVESPMIDIFDLKEVDLTKIFKDKNSFEPIILDKDIFEDFKFIGNPIGGEFVYIQVEKTPLDVPLVEESEKFKSFTNILDIKIKENEEKIALKFDLKDYEVLKNEVVDLNNKLIEIQNMLKIPVDHFKEEIEIYDNKNYNFFTYERLSYFTENLNKIKDIIITMLKSYSFYCHKFLFLL